MIDNIYEKICSFDNLLLAYNKARKGKNKKWYVREFRKNLEINLTRLEAELIHMTYEPRPMKTFVIRDPKTRVISASNFNDRVVHHALCNVIEPIFEKSFIYDSYANRKGKGTHAALARFDSFKRKISHNGKLLPNAKGNNQVYGYVLKADIRHYFDSVNHEILIQIINRKINDGKVIWLVRKILNNHRGEGMPIGNLTSQFFANVYLNELDRFIKHELKAKHYIRYVDDFIIFEFSKEKLGLYKARIDEFLKTIRLELHPDKSRIISLHRGVNFLGFRIFYYYKLPKKSNLRLMKQKIDDFADLYEDGIMSRDDVMERICGWEAYASHGNTFKMRRLMMKKLLAFMK
jgi:RNA-directed DNA polymerase